MGVGGGGGSGFSTGEHPLNPVFLLTDSGSFGSINFNEIHKQGLVDDKPVSAFAGKGNVYRTYDDERLCDYIEAHGLEALLRHMA